MTMTFARMPKVDERTKSIGEITNLFLEIAAGLTSLHIGFCLPQDN